MIVRRGRHFVDFFIAANTRAISSIVPVAEIGSIAPYRTDYPPFSIIQLN